MVNARRVYIHAASAFVPYAGYDAPLRQPLTADPDTDLRAVVKAVLGKPLRQASHFVELAVIGAQSCLKRLNSAPSPEMAVYLGTGLGEVRKTESLFQQVLPPGSGMAAPFDFINATANMAAFYVARLADLSTRNLTITQGLFSFERALQLAFDDVRAGDVPCALVGGVDENCFPRTDYLRRWSLAPEQIMGEGSAWLYLSSQSQGAIAELTGVHRIEPQGDVSAWARVAGNVIHEREARNVLAGIGVGATERAALASDRVNWHEYLPFCGHYPSVSAVAAAMSMQQPRSSENWIHLNRDTDNSAMLMCWRT